MKKEVWLCLTFSLFIQAAFDEVITPSPVIHSSAQEILRRQEGDRALLEEQHRSSFDKATNEYQKKRERLQSMNLSPEDLQKRASQLDKKLAKKRNQLAKKLYNDQYSLSLKHEQERQAAIVDPKTVGDVTSRARALVDNIRLRDNLHDYSFFDRNIRFSKKDLTDQLTEWSDRVQRAFDEQAEQEPDQAREWQLALEFMKHDIEQAKDRIMQEELQKAHDEFWTDSEVQAALLYMRGSPPYSREHIQQAYEGFQDKVHEFLGNSIQAEEVLRLFAKERDKLLQEVEIQEKRDTLKKVLPDDVQRALQPQELERFIDLMSTLAVSSDAFKSAQLAVENNTELAEMTKQVTLTIVRDYKDVIELFKKPEVHNYIRGLWEKLSKEQQIVIKKSFYESLKKRSLDVKGFALVAGGEVLSFMMVGGLIKLLITVL